MKKLGNQELLRIFAKHDPYWDTGHLGDVLAEMKVLGPPTIRVVDWRDDYFALEASHRLASAYYLGLVPRLIVETPDRFDQSDESFWDSLKDKLPHYSWLI